jgi:hypothetical protein
LFRQLAVAKTDLVDDGDLDALACRWPSHDGPRVHRACPCSDPRVVAHRDDLVDGEPHVRERRVQPPDDALDGFGPTALSAVLMLDEVRRDVLVHDGQGTLAEAFLQHLTHDLDVALGARRALRERRNV